MADRVTRFIADFTDQAPWVAEDIARNLPPAVPESAIEAMLMARRNVRMNPKRFPMGEDDVRLLPHEWDEAEALRYGRGYETRMYRPPARQVPNEYGDIPGERGGMVFLPSRRKPKRISVALQHPQPYAYDADEVRLERRLHSAAGILEQARQNPDILSQLPPVFRLPLEDRLIARLAAEGPSAYVPVAREIIDPKVAAARKFLSEHPELLGAGIGAGGTLAYGLMGEE